MQTIQLFINVNKPGLNNEWNSNVEAALKALPTIEQVQIIEENEQSHAQISMNYDAQMLSINQIEKTVSDNGAYITDINVHFSSGITGIGDPYRAGAVSITINDKLKKIDGVLSGTISSRGELKVVLDTTNSNKQEAIDKIIKYFQP